MKKDIENYVISCPIDALAKRYCGKSLGFLLPMVHERNIHALHCRTAGKFREHSDLGHNQLFSKHTYIVAFPRYPLTDSGKALFGQSGVMVPMCTHPASLTNFTTNTLTNPSSATN